MGASSPVVSLPDAPSSEPGSPQLQVILNHIISAPVVAYQLHILSNDFQSKKEKRAEGAAEGL